MKILIAILFKLIISNQKELLTPKLSTFISKSITSLDSIYNFENYILYSENVSSFEHIINGNGKTKVICSSIEIPDEIIRTNSLIILVIHEDSVMNLKFISKAISKLKTIAIFLNNLNPVLISSQFLFGSKNYIVISENDTEITIYQYCPVF